jgi:hypothetical protein
MAASGCLCATSSNILTNCSSEVIDFRCERCQELENQLKYSLDELSSAQVIINILKNELLIVKAPVATCVDDQFPITKFNNITHTESWTQVPSNNKLAKKVSIDLISPDKCVLTVNRFAPLAKPRR